MPRGRTPIPGIPLCARVFAPARFVRNKRSGMRGARLFDPKDELVFRHRLVQQFYADARRTRFERGIAAPGHHEGRSLIALRPQKLKQIEAGHARHMLIDQKAIRFLVAVAQEDFGRGVIAHFIAIGFQQGPCGIPNRIVVVDYIYHRRQTGPQKPQ